MKYKDILFIADNEFLYKNIKDLVYEKATVYDFNTVDFNFSVNNQNFFTNFNNTDFRPIDLNKEVQHIIMKYDIVFSLHCMQIFPKKLVNSVICINVHPGYNPYNRGWYPQVFSIINGLPIGATIHIMDEEIDHGPIIDQQQVEIHSWDTSLSLYNKILDSEVSLIRENFDSIITGNFKTYKPEIEGNINYKSDYAALRELKLEQVDSFESFLNRLRALTHGAYRNCYFNDKEGNKVYVKILLEKE